MPKPATTKDILLIVDDEEDIRLNLCDFMELEGFEILEAENGIKALEILESNTPSAVISDLMMPEMGGMELLEEIGKRELAIPAVIMTAFGTIDYAVKAMKVGAADFITKPIDYDYMLRVVRRVLKAAELERKVKEQQQQMDADLRLAGKIQKAILPKPIQTPELCFDYRFEPLIEIGGDHLIAHQYEEDHIAVALFDVSGHGVSAAMVANMVHNELMARLKEERPPFNIVERLNRFMQRTIGETGMFLTMVMADVDLGLGNLVVSNAAHPDVFIWKKETNSLEAITSHVPAVGFGMKMVGDPGETKTSIATGDRIVMFTDGFPETQNQEGQMLKLKGLREIVQKHVHLPTGEFIDAVFSSADEFRAGVEPDDDQTLAVVEIK